MRETPEKLFYFAKFKMDPREHLLFDGNNSISLPPKAFDTLLLLVENAGHIISKEEMMEKIWQGSFVEENNLAQNISLLRRVLGEGIDGAKYIETVSKRGYRFIAGVSQKETSAIEGPNAENEDEIAGSAKPSPARASKPETRYAQNGEVNIAYQVAGSGDIDIVFVMGWVSHLEYFWEEPHFAAFLDRLASFSRLILFDKRGTGLSDRVPLSELPTLEQRMEDVNAVMEAVGSKRAVLIGVSEGGPMCSLFAATYPEKTLALVMIGTYAKRIRDDDYPWAPTQEQREAFFELMRKNWGGPVGIEERAPGLAEDQAFRDWWATYLRMGASPSAALALTQMNAEIDVRGVLPSIRVPSLVIHRKGDLCLKVEEGRYVASRIPGCKYAELEGTDHLPFVGNQGEILDEIESFLSGIKSARAHDRVLATVASVVFKRPGSQGEAEWKETIENLRSFTEMQVRLFKGKLFDFNSEGFLAAFDGPARAARCSQALSETFKRLELAANAGIHTGECDLAEDIYSGMAVEIAKEISREGADGMVLVSRTVKDLVAGSGLSFAETGIMEFPEPIGGLRLFRVY